MNLGEKINYYRKKKGLMQAELGAQLFVTRQTVSLWEKGQTLPSLDNIVRLAEIFGITIDELLCKELPTERDGEAESEEQITSDTELVKAAEEQAESNTEALKIPDAPIKEEKTNKRSRFFTKRPFIIIASLVGLVAIFCALFLILSSKADRVPDDKVEAVIGAKLPEYKSRSVITKVQETEMAKIISITEILFDNDVIEQLSPTMDDELFSGLGEIIGSAFIYKDCELYALYSEKAERRVRRVTDSGAYLFASYDAETKILRITEFEYK